MEHGRKRQKQRTITDARLASYRRMTRDHSSCAMSEKEANVLLLSVDDDGIITKAEEEVALKLDLTRTAASKVLRTAFNTETNAFVFCVSTVNVLPASDCLSDTLYSVSIRLSSLATQLS